MKLLHAPLPCAPYAMLSHRHALHRPGYARYAACRPVDDELYSPAPLVLGRCLVVRARHCLVRSHCGSRFVSPPRQRLGGDVSMFCPGGITLYLFLLRPIWHRSSSGTKTASRGRLMGQMGGIWQWQTGRATETERQPQKASARRTLRGPAETLLRITFQQTGAAWLRRARTY